MGSFNVQQHQNKVQGCHSKQDTLEHVFPFYDFGMMVGMCITTIICWGLNSIRLFLMVKKIKMASKLKP